MTEQKAIASFRHDFLEWSCGRQPQSEGEIHAYLKISPYTTLSYSEALNVLLAMRKTDSESV